MATQAYRDLKHKMPSAEHILKYQIDLMCSDVANFAFPKYVYNCAAHRLGYKDLDDYDYNWLFGYRTVFACLHEAERGELGISDRALRHHVRLGIKCGAFSYANIKPDLILGVSGTVGALAAADWLLLNSYYINSVSVAPSWPACKTSERFADSRSLVKTRHPGKCGKSIVAGSLV